jgi:hypothetical protein
VRNAILYVLANFRKHEPAVVRIGLDPYSSAACFGGWREWCPGRGVPPPLAEWAPWCRVREDSALLAAILGPRSWLAAVGWRRGGPLGMGERPKVRQ